MTEIDLRELAGLPPIIKKKEVIKNLKEGMSKQVKLYGKTIPISKLQDIHEDLKNNLETLVVAVNDYLKGYKNAYNNIKNPEYSEVIRKYKNMLKAKKFLETL